MLVDKDKILTLHPAGKKGVNISLVIYNLIKSFIVDTLQKKGVVSYKDLDQLANEMLGDKIDGSVSWYFVTVKLDLEARNLICRIEGKSGHQLKLCQ